MSCRRVSAITAGMVFPVVLALCVALIGPAWSSEDSSGEQSSKPDTKKATQSAPSPQTQTQSAEDEIPRLIVVTPTSKNAVTIETPVGVQEGTQRRYETYDLIGKKATKEIQDTRRAVKKSGTAESEAEETATNKEAEAKTTKDKTKDKAAETDDKPPLL